MSFGSVFFETPARYAAAVAAYTAIVFVAAHVARWVAPSALSSAALYVSMAVGVLAHVGGTLAYRYIASDRE